MNYVLRKNLSHTALAIGGALIWGIIELVALNRSRQPSTSKQEN